MKRIYLRVWVFIMIISLIAVLYSLLFGRTMTEFLSLIKMENVISYDKTCALIGSIPLIGYTVIALVRVLLSQNVQYRSLPDPFESLVLTTITVSFAIGLIANCIIPFFLLAFSYTSCPQKKLHDFYVTDIELCKTVVDNRGLW
ncbi:Uncharacterised protein [Salmonella enterica subsp. salamae]|uniref:DUF1240 domain-containing protein n=1 Tax=Salmonella enterica subsp. salamae serovar 30:1,z28:z6 TaxID=1967615 RepID=A0A737XWR1_SALER|nr:hypothetical protein [Salmonella enterica]ECD9458459.1 hypothetical protein [Salmonella enterica subsp. salamae]HAE8609215.1 hypothetical protein [Salmonella enterica subsp. salamae serovar 30:1,z28:z6]EEL1114297.1 hypothetical protein [Salmonella enterica]SQJ36857.1 Uncharacterised protein [Salmonella enterica]